MGRPTSKSKWKVVFKIHHEDDGPDREVFERYDGSWEHVDEPPQLRTYLQKKFHREIYNEESPEYPGTGDKEALKQYRKDRNLWWKRKEAGEIFVVKEAWTEDEETEVSYWISGIKFVDPFEFDDEFYYVGYGRGRSAAYFEWETMYGKMQMFMTDMDELLKKTTIVNGTVSGHWGFKKFGSNIGVCYLGPINAETENS